VGCRKCWTTHGRQEQGTTKLQLAESEVRLRWLRLFGLAGVRAYWAFYRRIDLEGAKAPIRDL
jgi:hypothetical protein